MTKFVDVILLTFKWSIAKIVTAILLPVASFTRTRYNYADCTRCFHGYQLCDGKHPVARHASEHHHRHRQPRKYRGRHCSQERHASNASDRKQTNLLHHLHSFPRRPHLRHAGLSEFIFALRLCYALSANLTVGHRQWIHKKNSVAHYNNCLRRAMTFRVANNWDDLWNVPLE